MLTVAQSAEHSMGLTRSRRQEVFNSPQRMPLRARQRYWCETAAARFKPTPRSRPIGEKVKEQMTLWRCSRAAERKHLVVAKCLETHRSSAWRMRPADAVLSPTSTKSLRPHQTPQPPLPVCGRVEAAQ